MKTTQIKRVPSGAEEKFTLEAEETLLIDFDFSHLEGYNIPYFGAYLTESDKYTDLDSLKKLRLDGEMLDVTANEAGTTDSDGKRGRYMWAINKNVAGHQVQLSISNQSKNKTATILVRYYYQIGYPA